MRLLVIAFTALMLAGAANGPPLSKAELIASIKAAEAASSRASCRAAIGQTKALNVVKYCRWVSSATHPPCNIENSCPMMIEHIRYMCRATDEATLSACQRLYGG
jgi:hypothetical protein